MSTTYKDKALSLSFTKHEPKDDDYDATGNSKATSTIDTGAPWSYCWICCECLPTTSLNGRRTEDLSCMECGHEHCRQCIYDPSHCAAALAREWKGGRLRLNPKQRRESGLDWGTGK